VRADLAAALAALEPEIGAAETEPVALDGGITNRNFRLTAGGRDVVVRLPGKDTELLGIDRAAERAATAAAAAAGVGPAVVAYRESPPCLVTAFIPGLPVTAEGLREPGALADVAAALRAVHAGAGLPSQFDALAVVEGYHATARERGAAIPPAYHDVIGGARRIRAALQGPEHLPVPCHNDLLTANLIDDGVRVRIVDWEYAGMGDVFFDLANFSINHAFDHQARMALLEAYFGEVRASNERWLELMLFMSDFREAMWGVIQGAMSELDFDFGAYAGEHFERMEVTAASPSFVNALEPA